MIWLLLIPGALAVLAVWSGLKAREDEADAFDAHTARLMEIRDGR